MKKMLFIVALISIFAIQIASATSNEPINNGSMKITIKDDKVTVKLRDLNGKYKRISFDKDDFSNLDNFKKEFEIARDPRFQVRDELLIENGNIIIDGETIAYEDITKIHVSGEFDQGVSLHTELPFYHRCEMTCDKDIHVDSESTKDRFGFGGLVVEAGETIYGDVVALTGDITVYGEVMGDVVSVFGDVVMYDGAFAAGDVVTPFGELVERGSIRIDGNSMPRSRTRIMGRDSDVDFDLTARYNRVEGFTLISGIKYEDSYGELPDFYFKGGYAFSLEKWDLEAGLRQQFGNDYAFYFGADLYQGAATSDEWMFSIHENTIASLIFKEDYHDFYYRKGINLYAGQTLSDEVTFQLNYTAENIDTLTKNTNSALFGGKKNFRENYSTIDNPYVLNSLEGERQTLALSFTWDNRDSEEWTRRGQYANIVLETAGDDGYIGGLGGDHSYDRISATFANYLPLNRKQHLGLVLKGGYSEDNLPLDKWFFLGGPGSLRGYDFKEYYGNRYFLANLDYYFEFSNDFSLAIFGDIGKAGTSQYSFENNDFKSDIGVGIMFEDAFRLDISQRLDDLDKSPVVMARSVIHF